MHNAKPPMGLKIRSIVLLAGVCFLLFFWRLGNVPFYVRGEPREGLVVQEMLATSDWILPTVNGEYIPFKPPLFHWVAALAAKGLGKVDEFTLRFPSALFATLGVFLVYLAGARLWEERVGLVSAIVLATNHEWWKAASLAQVDMTLAFFMAAALLLFLLIYQEGTQAVGIPGPLGIALFLALATLAKGPIGSLVPLLVFFFFLLLRHNLAFLKKLNLFANALIFLLVAGAWYALALRQSGAEFFRNQIVDENLRTAIGTYGHYQSPFYFIPLFLSNMAPWSFFLPCIAFFAYRERRWLSEDKVSYLWVWIVTVFVFFSLARGKRGIYILPLYPAAALLFGVWWLKLEKGEIRGLWFVRAIGYFIVAFYLTIPGVFLIRFLGWDIFARMRLGDTRHEHAEFSLVLRSLEVPSWQVWACLALSTLAAWVLIWALIKKRRDVVFVSLAVGVIVTVLAIKEVYYPAMSAERTMKPFMMRVGKVVDNETRLFFYRSFDYGAVFYAERHIHEYPDKAPFPKPPFFLLMWEEEWERVHGSNSLEMLDTSEGIGPARKPHHLVLVKVKGVETSLRGKPASDDQQE